MTVKIAGFLSGRLDEKEAIAQAATAGPWHIPEHDPLFYCVDSSDGSGRICKFGDRSCGDDVNNSLHIVRHDPARVLRDIAAKRVVLAEYAAFREVMDEQQAAGEQTGAGVSSGARLLEHLIRVFAAVDCDHPDYDRRWRP